MSRIIYCDMHDWHYRPVHMDYLCHLCLVTVTLLALTRDELVREESACETLDRLANGTEGMVEDGR